MNPHTSGKVGTVLILLFFLPFIPIGCVSKQSEVATKLGYGKSVKVYAGPYQLHQAHEGTNDFVLLAEGNWDVYSRYTGEGTDLYLDGEPFIHFERNSDGSVTNLFLHIRDTHGKAEFDLIDRNADGQWDVKIDDITKRVFIWKDGAWVRR